jgi:hypothetical protein
VGVDTGRLEIGMTQRLRNERDRRTIVDGMTCVRMSEPVRGRGLVTPARAAVRLIR